MVSGMITRLHLIFRFSHLERSDLQIGRHVHNNHGKILSNVVFQSLNINHVLVKLTIDRHGLVSVILTHHARMII